MKNKSINNNSKQIFNNKVKSQIFKLPDSTNMAFDSNTPTGP